MLIRKQSTVDDLFNRAIENIVLWNFRVDLLEIQYNFISIMLGFVHSPPFTEVILYGDKTPLKLRSPIPHFPAIRGSFI